METIEQGLAAFSSFLWGDILVYLLLGTHLFLTLRLGIIQRYLFRGIRLSVKRSSSDQGDISGFGALTSALSATLGAGNIIGVATAVQVGGPGAIFWMWITGVLGIATKYGEVVLSVKYRKKNKRGEIAGGPMYVLEYGLRSKWLALLFALLTAVAGFGIGNMFQAYSISTLMEANFAVSPWVTGVLLMGLTSAVTLGGIRSIARVSQVLVPFMTAAYLLGCFSILFLHADRLPGTFVLIVTSAFSGQAALGGFAGAGLMAVLRAGVSRGLFSNEAGLGSAPIIAAAAQTPNPVRQGLISATGTFWDTVVVCLISGLVLVSSGAWTQYGPDGQALEGAEMTNVAFAQVGFWGPMILTLGLATFGFSTILGWSYYGEKALEYLLGVRAILPYRVLWVGIVFLGAVTSPTLIFHFSDVANGLMALPNLIALLLLSGVIAQETRRHIRDLESVSPEILDEETEMREQLR